MKDTIMTDRDDDRRGGVIDAPLRGEPSVKEKPKVKKPSMYHVIMLNDDYTPMDFVVNLIQRVFHHGLEHATHIMLEIHRKGKGICGTYTLEVAEMKVDECMTHARMAEHPLQVIYEKA